MNTKNIKTKEDVIEFLNNEDSEMLKKIEVEFDFKGEVCKFNLGFVENLFSIFCYNKSK